MRVKVDPPRGDPRAAARGDHRCPGDIADRRRGAARHRTHRDAEPADRRWIRHHHGADRARVGVVVPASRRAHAAEPESRHSAGFRHRRIPPVFYPRARRRPDHRRGHRHLGVHLKEGERLRLSWAMANRDPALFGDPDTVILDRKGNRHFSFGVGIHRCVGSNVARTVLKSMLTAVLDRMPDYVCIAEGTVHYDTIGGVIQGMRHLPATFTSRPRPGAGCRGDGPTAAATLR